MDEYILSNVDQQREIVTKLHQFSENKRNFYDQGNVCGVSTFWKNNLHPYALYFSAYLSPSSKHKEILFNKIVSSIEDEAKQMGKSTIICHDYAPQLSFNEIAIKNGFELIRTTVEPDLLLSEISEMKLSDEANYQVVTFSAIKNDPKLINRLTQNHYQDYKKSHKANPVADLTTSQWKSFVFTGQIDSAPIAIINDNEVLAYTFLFEDFENVLTVGWMGAKQRKALDMLHQIQIDWAKSRFKTLAGEFDSTDSLAMDFYRSLPFQLCPVYETFLKRIDY